MSASSTDRTDPEIRQGLDQLAWRREKIEAGLKEADAGEFASEGEVALLRAKFADAT